MFYRFARGLLRILFPLIWNLKVENRQGLNREGAFILSANHIYWLDPIAVALKSNRVIHFLGKKELFEDWFHKWLFNALQAVPIDRDNPDIKGVRAVLKTLKNGEVMGIFPEGTRTGSDVMTEMHDGAAFFALRTGCPIIPCGITGSIKFRGKIQLVVGEPMMLEEYKGRKATSDDVAEVTAKLEEEIVRLAEKARSMI